MCGRSHSSTAPGTSHPLTQAPRASNRAGHHVGEGYSVQANMMLNDKVVPAMAKAYESTVKETSPIG